MNASGPSFLRPPSSRSGLRSIISVLCISAMLASTSTAQAQSTAPQASTPTNTSPKTGVPHAGVPVSFEMPKSRNPLNAYSADYVPEPLLTISPRIDRLVRDGQLYLSLKDAIDLALENNLDLAIARYNLPIANTDILRTQGSSYQTLSAQRDLSLAALDLVTAMTVFEKARVELDRAIGATLEHNGIQLQNAVTGTVGDTISAASP